MRHQPSCLERSWPSPLLLIATGTTLKEEVCISLDNCNHAGLVCVCVVLCCICIYAGVRTHTWACRSRKPVPDVLLDGWLFMLIFEMTSLIEWGCCSMFRWGWGHTVPQRYSAFLPSSLAGWITLPHQAAREAGKCDPFSWTQMCTRCFY